MLKHALKNRYKSNFAVTVLKREINSPDTKSNLSACRNTNAGQQLLTDPKSAGSRNVSIYIAGAQSLRTCWLTAAVHGDSGGRDDPQQQLLEALWL